MRSRHRAQRGMTLMELMVAIALLSVVMTMAFKILSEANRYVRRQREVSEAAQAGWQSVERICRDLAMALPSSEYGGKTEFASTDGVASLYDVIPKDYRLAELRSEQSRVKLAADSVRFPVTRLYSGEAVPVMGMVEYALERDSEGGILGLVRRTAPAGVPFEEAEEKLVNKRAVSLDLEFAGADGQWQPVWRSQEPPRTVRVKVGVLATWTRGRPQVMVFSTVVYPSAGMRISK